MDIKLFGKILYDENTMNLKKLTYKYGKDAVADFINTSIYLKRYTTVNTKAYKNMPLVYTGDLVHLAETTYKTLLLNEFSKGLNPNILAVEIENTLKIENIKSNKKSIRNIVIKGLAPQNDEEKRILGIKKGLEFISDTSNTITEENLYKLYNISIADTLEEDDKLKPGQYYRHDVVGVYDFNKNKYVHYGFENKILPKTMESFIQWINRKQTYNQLIKSTIIHFYFAFIHPYFDGNGRMSRLLQQWYLIQNEFNATLSVPFSKLISETKQQYYKAFELVEDNSKISNFIDVTPFLAYFNKNVFLKLESQLPDKDILKRYKSAIKKGNIHKKQQALFLFALFRYGENEFSTVKLKKDFEEKDESVSYETVRKFVMKLEELGFLTSKTYSKNRKTYKFLNI